ncbi:SET domain-containing protein [Nannocystaceae bacterium ST9]
MIYPGTELRLVDEQTGYGVFATRFIPAGTVVWMHDELDQVLTPARVATLPEALQRHVERYAYVNAEGNRVLCWDHGRYMNHSCEPSATSIGTLMEIARRDIHPGDQLTCEYGLAHVIEGFECTCGAPNCRGKLLPTDMPEVWRRWDREAAEAFALALKVEQPVLAAARATGSGAWIVEAIRERRAIELPSWSEGVPGGA